MMGNPDDRPSYPPADFRRRMLARLIDLFVAALPIVLVPHAHLLSGILFSAAFLLFGDSLFGAGRSLGKRLTGLRVVVVPSRRPAGVRESALRNLPIAAGLLPAAFGVQPPVAAATLGCVLLLEAAVALRPLAKDLGQRRLGDFLAGTQVFDGRMALPLAAPAVAPAAPAAAPLASRTAPSAPSAAIPPAAPASTRGRIACASP
jgi:uncharacterized RDD family membrane protein YckC